MDNPHAFVVEIPGRDPVPFALPWAPTLARLQRLIAETSGDPEREWLAWGAVIGSMDVDDLTPFREEGDDWLDYGAAVLSYMHDAGWDLRDLTRLRLSLGKRIGDAVSISKEEVDERLGFSAAR